jgi:hypothetical protein
MRRLCDSNQTRDPAIAATTARSRGAPAGFEMALAMMPPISKKLP